MSKFDIFFVFVSFSGVWIILLVYVSLCVPFVSVSFSKHFSPFFPTSNPRGFFCHFYIAYRVMDPLDAQFSSKTKWDFVWFFSYNFPQKVFYIHRLVSLIFVIVVVVAVVVAVVDNFVSMEVIALAN